MEKTQKEMAATTMEFLKRVQMNGNEAHVFVNCFEWLRQINEYVFPEEDDHKDA